MNVPQIVANIDATIDLNTHGFGGVLQWQGVGLGVGNRVTTNQHCTIRQIKPFDDGFGVAGDFVGHDAPLHAGCFDLLKKLGNTLKQLGVDGAVFFIVCQKFGFGRLKCGVIGINTQGGLDHSASTH